MPLRRFGRKKMFRRRRVYRRRKPIGAVRRRNPTKLTVRGANPFPDRMRVRLQYTEYIDLSTTSPTPIIDYLFRGNSVYDPNYSGTGYQPLGFDKYAELYNKYLVRGATCKIVVIPDSSQAVNLAIFATDSATSITTQQDLFNRGNVVSKMVLPIGSVSSPSILKMYRSTRKMGGLQKLTNDEDSWIAQVSGNPGNSWFFHILSGPANQTSLPSTAVHIRVELTYYVEFFQRKVIYDG